MLFTEPAFFALVTITFALYYLPFLKRHQVAVLIVASLFFYAYGQPYLLFLLLLSAAISTLTSHRVLTADSHARAVTWASIGVTLNLFILALFKYDRLIYDTFSHVTDQTDEALRWVLFLPLPIGISFYSFHGISLLIDALRRGNVSGEETNTSDRSLFRHVPRTFLYLTFFPQLIAGPIVKAHDFYPQIKPKYVTVIDWEGAATSLITGYFLKCVVADNLAEQTFWLQYPYFTAFSTGNLLIFLFGYSMQIFSDFAGYSLIAIGLGRLFGYKLPDNFQFPYISQTFAEFWTRWHISLSSWLREYLYFPLGGNRKGPLRTYLNLLIVMGLGGLWHGGAWSYAIWGLWHGGALVIERFFRGTWFYRASSPLMQCVRTMLVFGVVTAGWLLFKMPAFYQVIIFIQTLAANRSVHFSYGTPFAIFLYSTPVVAYHIAYLVRRRTPAFAPSRRSSYLAIRNAVLGTMLAATFLTPGEPVAFIYFQF